MSMFPLPENSSALLECARQTGRTTRMIESVKKSIIDNPDTKHFIILANGADKRAITNTFGLYDIKVSVYSYDEAVAMKLIKKSLRPGKKSWSGFKVFIDHAVVEAKTPWIVKILHEWDLGNEHPEKKAS